MVADTSKRTRTVFLSLDTAGRGCNGQGGLGCTLMGHVGTKRRGSSWSAYDQADINLKHSLLHPDYLVGTFPALFNVDTGGSPTVVIWGSFPRTRTPRTCRV